MPSSTPSSSRRGYRYLRDLLALRSSVALLVILLAGIAVLAVGCFAGKGLLGNILVSLGSSVIGTVIIALSFEFAVRAETTQLLKDTIAATFADPQQAFEHLSARTRDQLVTALVTSSQLPALGEDCRDTATKHLLRLCLQHNADASDPLMVLIKEHFSKCKRSHGAYHSSLTLEPNPASPKEGLVVKVRTTFFEKNVDHIPRDENGRLKLRFGSTADAKVHQEEDPDSWLILYLERNKSVLSPSSLKVGKVQAKRTKDAAQGSIRFWEFTVDGPVAAAGPEGGIEFVLEYELRYAYLPPTVIVDMAELFKGCRLDVTSKHPGVRDVVITPRLTAAGAIGTARAVGTNGWSFEYQDWVFPTSSLVVGIYRA
jgi:hypothetical protein